MERGWVLLGLLCAAYAAAAWIIGLLWNRVLVPLTLRTSNELDTKLARAAMRPFQIVMFVVATHQTLKYLSGRPDMRNSLIASYLEGLLVVLAVLSVTWFAIRLLEEFARWYLERIGRRTEVRLDLQFMPLLSRVLRLALFFVAATMVLGFYDIKITALLGAAGVASLAVALAAQESIANMIGGITIMIDRPFRVGDRIEMPDGRLGDVQEIGMRTTKILTFDRTLLIIPNAEIVKQTVTNHCYPDPKMFTRQKLGVAYGSDLDKVKRVLLEVINAHPRVLEDPAARIYFTDFGESSLDLLLYYAVDNYANRFSVLDEVNMEIKKRFEKEGIEIPFPQRVVTMRREGQA